MPLNLLAAALSTLVKLEVVKTACVPHLLMKSLKFLLRQLFDLHDFAYCTCILSIKLVVKYRA